MAFKAKVTTLTFDANKRYFWQIANLGNGINHFGYVSADTAAAMEISGYFNDDELEFTMNAGDRITIWTVDAISDTRSLQDDFFSGLNAIYQSVVMANDGSGVQIAPLSEKWSLEYTLP
jgi:hypothetical protein